MDWNRLDELRSEIGEDDLAEVLGLFLEEVQERLVHIEAGQGRSAAEDLHFVKSAALNIGFVSLAQLSASMEATAAAHGTPPDPVALRQCFETACATLKASGVSIEA